MNTKVVHSRKLCAWNVVNLNFGGKYKLAVVPYVYSRNAEVLAQQKAEALEAAEFISSCFNNMEQINLLLN